MDGGLGRTGDEANEACSAAPAFLDGEAARKMIEGKKEEPGCKTVEWAEHGVDVGMLGVVWM